MVSFEKMKDLISNANNIGLTYHVSPDGDAIGSLLAMKFVLEKLNKNVIVFSKDNLQTNLYLKFLPEINKIDGENFSVGEEIDLLIVVDCGNRERVSCDFNDDKIITLGIDHHISNNKYCTYNFVNGSSSSTGEIVYEFAKFLGVEIDENIATCIYTSIMTDTGGLRFECSGQRTFNIIGEIVSTGFKFWEVYEKLFLSQTYGKIKLKSLIYKNLKMVDEKICVMRITDEMLKESGVTEDQTGDVVSIGLTIDEAKVSILIKNFKDKTKVSLRGRDNINVCEVAQGFGGGGHIKASAFVTDLSMDEIEEILVEKFRKIINA